MGNNQSTRHRVAKDSQTRCTRKRSAHDKPSEITTSSQGDVPQSSDASMIRRRAKKRQGSIIESTTRTDKNNNKIGIQQEQDLQHKQTNKQPGVIDHSLEQSESRTSIITLKTKLEHRETIDLGIFGEESLQTRPHYQLEYIKFLGAGGQGEVHQVHDSLRAKDYALKIIKQNSAAKKYEKDALESMKPFAHPAIVQLETSLEDDDFLYLLTKFVDGLTVRDIVPYMEQFTMEKRLQFITPLLAELCVAVDFLHQRNFIHRDIKASNCFLDMNGRITIGDFGSCIQRDLIKPRVIFGTVPYTISPEMFSKTPYAEEADYWGVGVLACELALGFFPFEWFTRDDIKSKETVNEVIATIKNPQIPEEVATNYPHLFSLLIGFLCPDPCQRLGSQQIGGLSSIENHDFFKTIDFSQFKDPLLRERQQPVLKLMKAIQKKRAAKKAQALAAQTDAGGNAGKGDVVAR